ncbi:MAG: hypoxanthine phosphoribosyltransferase [Clostridiales bacterium]|nr:hypoxanthine phosphoribosyltransferase [Clostridiales bacterium]MDY5677379.1 hypoxanthine phosphoribosyltransferase [Eubacteriales bacterium]
MEDLMADIQGTLIGKEDLQLKCKELGAKISRDYQNKRPLFIGILKGCVMFYSDLVRNVSIDCEMDFMVVSSYGAGKTSSGEVKIIKDTSASVEGRHVIFVEDIVDSGVTLNYLINLFKARNAASVEICTLLDKPERRQRDVHPKYTGFVIPNEFVVGYGLDFDEKYRNIPEVCVLKH